MKIENPSYFQVPINLSQTSIILDKKENLSILQKVKLIQKTFPDHNAVKLEVDKSNKKMRPPRKLESSQQQLTQRENLKINIPLFQSLIRAIPVLVFALHNKLSQIQQPEKTHIYNLMFSMGQEPRHGLMGFSAINISSMMHS